jgi:hypothetical protein
LKSGAQRSGSSASRSSASAWATRFWVPLGGKTYKLKFGHRGGNHPVLNKRTNKVEITAHNHGFAVDPIRSGRRMSIDAWNLNDETPKKPASSPCRSFGAVSPEARPAPRFVLPVRRFHENDGGVARMAARLKPCPDEKRLKKRHQKILIIGSGPIIIRQPGV